MAKFTLLELHLDGAEFTANAPGSAVPGGDADVVADDGDSDEAAGSKRGAAILALLVVALALAAGKKLLGGSDDLPEVDLGEE